MEWSQGSGFNHHNRETANIMKSVDLYRISQIGILACALNVYGQEGSNNVEQRVNSILSQMTLDEKISYIGGTPFFDVKPIPLPNLQTPLNPRDLSDRCRVRRAEQSRECTLSLWSRIGRDI